MSIDYEQLEKQLDDLSFVTTHIPGMGLTVDREIGLMGSMIGIEELLSRLITEGPKFDLSAGKDNEVKEGD